MLPATTLFRFSRQPLWNFPQLRPPGVSPQTRRRNGKTATSQVAKVSSENIVHKNNVPIELRNCFVCRFLNHFSVLHRRATVRATSGGGRLGPLNKQLPTCRKKTFTTLKECCSAKKESPRSDPVGDLFVCNGIFDGRNISISYEDLPSRRNLGDGRYNLSTCAELRRG